jgi:hypothetical protein
VYRSGLSYGVNKINLTKTRFFSIETIRIRVAQGQQFTELAKILISAAEKPGDTASVATYQVVSGAPNGSYLLLEPTKPLKSMHGAQQHQLALFRPWTMRA